MEKVYDRVVRPELLDELRAAGIPPTLPDDSPRLWYTDTTATVAYETEAALAVIEAVVNAHNPAAYIQVEDDTLLQFRQDKQRLQDFMAASNNTITLPMLVAIVKSLIRAVRYAVRELRDEG